MGAAIEPIDDGKGCGEGHRRQPKRDGAYCLDGWHDVTFRVDLTERPKTSWVIYRLAGITDGAHTVAKS